MGFYVPFDYIKLYSTKEQATKTLEFMKLYTTKQDIITDATAGIGGNSIFFARYYKMINCIEINRNTFGTLKSNLKCFKNCNFYNNDFLSICKMLKQDVIFLDPPWELNYKSKKQSVLGLSDVNIKDIIENLYSYCKIIAIKCPMNFEIVVNSWDFTTHYIYKNKKVNYKIIIYHKYT